MCLSIFAFDVWDKLWVLTRSVPDVSLLINFRCSVECVVFLLIGLNHYGNRGQGCVLLCPRFYGLERCRHLTTTDDPALYFIFVFFYSNWNIGKIDVAAVSI